jgi:hypothetical protein
LKHQSVQQYGSLRQSRLFLTENRSIISFLLFLKLSHSLLLLKNAFIRTERDKKKPKKSRRLKQYLLGVYKKIFGPIKHNATEEGAIESVQES